MIATSACATEFKIVEQQTLARADLTTHEIRSGGVVLGVSEYGGGYINKLYIPGIGDLLEGHAARFGRGGQVSIRDGLHSGRYNPTQAGFTDSAGTLCQVVQPQTGLIEVLPRVCALWRGDGKYDFIEWENLADDRYNNDAGNTDKDLLDESQLAGKQATEISSEFDLYVTYEDRMDKIKVNIPSFRIYFEFRFIRDPGHALKQFRRVTPSYNVRAEIKDRSNLAPAGAHPSAEDSLTDVILSTTLRGDRSVWKPAYVFFARAETGKLYLDMAAKKGYRARFDNPKSQAAVPLIVFSGSSNPDKGPALGYYLPPSEINKFSILGRNSVTNKLAYADQRLTRGTMIGSLDRTKHMWLFGARTNLLGMLNPKETPEGIHEVLRGEAYLLIGTPNEILSTAAAINPLAWD